MILEICQKARVLSLEHTTALISIRKEALNILCGYASMHMDKDRLYYVVFMSKTTAV